MLLGEARSKCDHVAGVPLRPDVANQLHRLFLAKGVMGTTAIEGNTLSEDQVLQVLEGKLDLPKSKQYLMREVENILGVCNNIIDTLHAPIALTPARICDFNRRVLDSLSLDDDVEPGVVRKHKVGVLNYRGAPPEDCDYLLEQLCEWLNGPTFDTEGDEDRALVYAIIKAVLAHLYVAWIHPFGDGNGRTARLIEFDILVQAGAPSPAAHLLSNFYNETRTEYYRQLDHASKSGGDVVPFLKYALQGLVDGLRDQVARIRDQQWDVAWRNYIHEVFDGAGETEKRQRDLLLDLSSKTEPIARADIASVSPRMATAYAHKGPRTVARDLNTLLRKDLIVRKGKGFVANRDLILAFLPRRLQKVTDKMELEPDEDGQIPLPLKQTN
jgi:Fic family protein